MISNVFKQDGEEDRCEMRLASLQSLIESWGGNIQPMLVTKQQHTPQTSSSSEQTAEEPTSAKKRRQEDDPVHAGTGDEEMYAIGSYNYEAKWFRVQVIRRRNKEPRVQVKFLSDLSGMSRPEFLPSPQRDWVHEVHPSVPKQ